MPMSAQKSAFISACKTAGNAPTDPDAALGAIFDAIVAVVHGATFTASGTLLAGPYPVTGVQEGGLS